MTKMLTRCTNCGAEVYVERPKSRSSKENRYFHGIVLELLSDFTGEDPETLKIFLKKKFGWIETKQVMGMMVEVPISTAAMSTTDFEKFMSQIRMFGDTLGVYIPEPNEENKLNER